MKIVLLVTFNLIVIFKNESATRGSTKLAYEHDCRLSRNNGKELFKLTRTWGRGLTEMKYNIESITIQTRFVPTLIQDLLT